MLHDGRGHWSLAWSVVWEREVPFQTPTAVCIFSAGSLAAPFIAQSGAGVIFGCFVIDRNVWQASLLGNYIDISGHLLSRATSPSRQLILEVLFVSRGTFPLEEQM